MMDFWAPMYGIVMSGITEARTIARLAVLTFGRSEYPEARALVQKKLSDVEMGILETLPLSQAVKSQFQNVKNRVTTCGLEEISVLLRDLHSMITVDMEQCHFLVIKAEKKELYRSQYNPPFGLEVHKVFPKAGIDIRAAGRCYALDEWTAGVFHLMRALEYGLKWLAKTVGLPDDQIDHEQWYHLINRAEKAIKALPRSDRQKALSQAAVQFMHFKDAWRNYVNHAQDDYDEKSAQPVWESTMRFMQGLATLASSPSH